MNRLSGKRALITGGTTGIGLETARQFLSEGARVAITGKNPATLEAAQKELGASVLVIPSDASDAAVQEHVAAKIKDAFGELDVLFVNAGTVDMRPIEQFDPEAFDRSFAINVKGPYFLIKSLLPIFANPGSIVLNGSVNAHIGMPNTTVYAATKAALISLARTLTGELVSPPLYSKLGLPEEQLKSVAASIQGQVPAGRFGSAVEIAKTVVYFASDESAFTLGSELLVDGGMSNI